MVSEKWKACAGVRAIRGRCPERSREGGKHERRPLGVNYFKEAGSRQVASGSGNPNDGVGTSSGVPTLQGTAGIGPGGRTPRQMTYVVGSQSQVPRSPSKSPPGRGGVPWSGEGGYPDTPGKRLSPLIYSNDEATRQSELEGMDSGGGPPGPSGGGGEPSSSARMRIDFGKQPSLEPPIFRDGDTFFDGLTGPMVTNQGENSAISGRTVMRGEQEEHTGSIPRGVGWQPIPGQDFVVARSTTPMETDRGPFGIHSLASLGVELASIGGPPPPPRRDDLRSSVRTQHSVDATMETAAVPEWRGGRHSQTGPSLLGAKGKRSKIAKFVDSVASGNAFDAGLNPVDADMPAKALSPPAHERLKKARVDHG
jgi:hypothetical protein